MTDARREAYLEAMGIVTWRRRDVPALEELTASVADIEPQPEHAHEEVPSASEVGVDLDGLRAAVAQCVRCGLSETRIQTVFGVGAQSATLMIIGEAPGAEEDARGEPFVGRAGQLLNAMLAAIGLDRDSVYITNILKCRPPRNRDPRPEEVVACSNYLHRQIEQVNPSALLAIGRIAAQNLLGVTTPIGKLRGIEHVHPQSNRPLFVTYHPAYLLRSPIEKRKAWQDLSQLSARLPALNASKVASA